MAIIATLPPHPTPYTLIVGENLEITVEYWHRIYNIGVLYVVIIVEHFHRYQLGIAMDYYDRCYPSYNLIVLNQYGFTNTDIDTLQGFISIPSDTWLKVFNNPDVCLIFYTYFLLFVFFIVLCP